MSIKITFGKNAFKPADDEQLVSALIAGDERAIQYVFYSHYNAMLRKIAKKQIGHLPIEYEDMVQELYLWMSEGNWSRLKKYIPKESKFDYWFSIKSNTFFRDYCRKKLYNITDFSSDNPIYSYMPSVSNWYDTELMRDLLRVLDFFQPPRDREILRALIVDDREPANVAEQYGITVDNLYSIKSKALARLAKKYLTGYDKNRK